MATIPFLESVNWFAVVGSLTRWIGYFILMGGIGLFTYVSYHVLSFKYKVLVFPLVGSGTTQGLSVGRAKGNRFKWNKTKTAWISLYPLFNRKHIQPFDNKYIYDGNRIYAFQVGEDYLPGCINISSTESKNILAEINPIPSSLRNWQALELQKNEVEFSKKTWWEDNKYVFMVLASSLICLAMVGLTVYFTYQFAAGGRGDISALTSALQNFGGLRPPG